MGNPSWTSLQYTSMYSGMALLTLTGSDDKELCIRAGDGKRPAATSF
jgi:hypothetical protein